ncbi:LOW QUALITY PROTEIN: Hypothetical protein PHPALM_17105 [Phytophthora palmivora]|uniref:Uncharacterized protein n=1 Tax=Phytophthora palmivora TaxID=4796 RepID=A0A2P4XN28_9STRA|nr:LOW QUALITY PROTEIN: Hypothetical protein PHPALM_17105 [Phytophthora palmivora]
MSAGTVPSIQGPYTWAKKPWTSYVQAIVDPRSQQPSGSQSGAGLTAPTISGTRDNLAISQAAGACQSATALGEFAPHGRGVHRSGQGEQDEPSHASQNEVPSQPLPSGPSTSGRYSAGTLLNDEVRRL